MKNIKNHILIYFTIILLLFISYNIHSQSKRSRSKRRKPNIYLITIDSLRADFLGCYGNKKMKTPFLDSFAETGTVFTHAFCQHPDSLKSHRTILSGTYPYFFNHIQKDKDIKTPHLAEILKENGYSTHAFISSRKAFNNSFFKKGFDTFNLPSKKNSGERTAEEIFKALSSRIHNSVKKPAFFWIHLNNAPSISNSINTTNISSLKEMAQKYNKDITSLDKQIENI